jgi:hypothetical protein
MGTYWGAQAYYTSGGPDGEGTYYNQPPRDSGVAFTEAPSGDGKSGNTIEVIYSQIMDVEPAHISALADQWQNMYNLLDDIRTQILNESNALHDEHWKFSPARDAFLKSGPGTTLAYLDEWATSALSNQTALRAMVGIVREAQSKMKTLWSQYQQAVKDAQNVSGWTEAWEGFWHYNLIPGGDQSEYNNAVNADKAQQVNEAHYQYNLKAQQQAWDLSGKFFDTFGSFSSGHGPVFMPPDAVLNQPGHPPFPTIPGGSPGGTPGGPPAVPRPAPAPPPPPAVPPGTPGADGQQQKLQDLLQKLNSLPINPGTAPQAVPGAPPLLNPTALAALAALAAGTPEIAPPPGTAGLSGTSAAFANAKLTGPASGILSRGAGVPELPGGMRSPAAPPLSRGNIRRPGAGSGEPGEGQPNQGRRSNRDALGRARGGAPSEPGLEEPFGRSPSGTAPPVLNNKRPNRPRVGSPEELTPETTGEDRPTSALGSDTTPPVLRRPGAGSPDGAPPPTQRSGRRKETKTGTSTTGTPLVAETDWTGAEAARTEAAKPVLSVPEPVLDPGSDLEEVPGVLRSRAASAADVGTGGSATRRGTAPPELTRRSRQQQRQLPEDAVERPGSEIVTDEEAFSVETPGGGVVGGRVEDSSYRQEPRATLGGS